MNLTAQRRERGGVHPFPRRQGRRRVPKVRLTTLIEAGTHAVIDAEFGPDAEQVQAQVLLGALEPGMLLLADRNYPSFKLWNDAAATGAQLLWRVKTSLHLPRVATVGLHPVAGGPEHHRVQARSPTANSSSSAGHLRIALGGGDHAGQVCRRRRVDRDGEDAEQPGQVQHPADDRLRVADPQRTAGVDGGIACRDERANSGAVDERDPGEAGRLAQRFTPPVRHRGAMHWPPLSAAAVRRPIANRRRIDPLRWACGRAWRDACPCRRPTAQAW